MGHPTLAADLVVERAWLEDRGGQLSWAEAQQRPTRPLQDVLSAGYSPHPVWLKLRIDPAAAGLVPGSQLVLRIRPAYLDEVTLFDPLQNPPQRPPVGDRYPAWAQAEARTAFVYHLPAGEQARDLWLRVHTLSARLVYAEVMTPQDYQLSATRLEHLGSLYLGLVAVFMLWGLIQALFKPEALMLSFLFYQTSALLLGASLWGYSNLLLSDVLGAPMVDLLTNLVIVLSSSAVIVFSYHVLNEMAVVVWRNRVVLGLLALYPLLLLGVLTGYTHLALQANMWLILLVPLLLWMLALLSPNRIPNDRRKQSRGLSKPMVVGYFSLTLVFTLLTAAPALGLIRGAEISIYIVFLYSICSGILMVLMLQYRAWVKLRQHSLLQAAAEQATQQAEQEQSSREDRERLLAMLGHELKTPLATLRMLLASNDVPDTLQQQLDRSVSEVAQVVERTLQSGQVDAQAVPVYLQLCHLPDLVTEVCRELPGGQRIEWRGMESGPIQVQTDPALLKLVLRHLLDNALKYSPTETSVQAERLPADATGQWSLLVSHPPGRAGLPDVQRLFSKYYRHPQAGHVTGAGLGLYLARNLARRLGGDVHYEPVTGLVRFHLTLP